MFNNKSGQMWIVYSVFALLGLIVWLLVSPMISQIIEETLGLNSLGGVNNFLIRLLIWAGLFFGLYKLINSVKGIGATQQ